MSEALISLKNDRLLVEIAKPGTMYAGSRFDWTGFITQVRLDDRHSFGAYESTVPGEGSGGVGFCNEFGLDHPIGYDEAYVGEGYLRVGIGTVLKYDDRPGDRVQMLSLKIAERAEISCEHTESEAFFRAKNPEINGYRCELEKRISLSGNCVRIDYSLKNTGKKPIHTEEYMHNFMCFDERYIGPDYRITIPVEPSEEMLAASRRIQPELMIGKDSLSFSHVFEGKAFFLKGAAKASKREYSWKIHEKTSGCSVCEIDSFDPYCLAIWGTKYVIAPEAFVMIDLLPYEECGWSRTLRFESEEKNEE